MNATVIPVRHPRRSLLPRGSGMLILAQALLLVGRAALWIAELLTSRPKRSRIRAFRQQSREMDHARAEMTGRLKQDPSTAIGEMDAFMERFGDDQMKAQHQAWRRDLDESLRRMRAPFEILKAHEGDPEGAVDALTRYRDEHPEDHHAWSCLAIALDKAGRQEESVAAWREAVRWAEAEGETPRMEPMHHVHLAGALAKMGRREEAETELRYVLENAPDDADGAIVGAYLGLGDLHRDAGDAAGARQAWNLACRWDTTGIIRKAVREKLAALP